MPEVLFPEYRMYVEMRQNANNAMMALLAGSRLAAHTLQLTEGSSSLLPEIFPAVPHIRRFNLKTGSARQLLLDADSHLGAVAVPYALAVHEDFVMSALSIMRSSGVTLNNGGKPVKSHNMHSVFFLSANIPEPASATSLFNLLRCMRNSQIHAGGVVSSSLSQVISKMQPSEIVEWTKLTGRPPADVGIQGRRLRFVTGDIVAAFAVTKRLGREVNKGLQISLSQRHWAEIAVKDFSAQTSNARNSDQWMRSLWGYARFYYGPVGLTLGELESAAISLGLWSRGAGAVMPRGERKKKKGGSSH